MSHRAEEIGVFLGVLVGCWRRWATRASRRIPPRFTCLCGILRDILPAKSADAGQNRLGLAKPNQD